MYFRNEPTENFSEKPAFNVKSNWNPPNGYPALEIFFKQTLPGIPWNIICPRKNG